MSHSYRQFASDTPPALPDAKLKLIDGQIYDSHKEVVEPHSDMGKALLAYLTYWSSRRDLTSLEVSLWKALGNTKPPDYVPPAGEQPLPAMPQPLPVMPPINVPAAAVQRAIAQEQSVVQVPRESVPGDVASGERAMTLDVPGGGSLVARLAPTLAVQASPTTQEATPGTGGASGFPWLPVIAGGAVVVLKLLL